MTPERVNPLYIDSTSYLVPDGPASVHAFETLRVALGQRMAVGSVVIRKATRMVGLTAAKDGFLVYMLRNRDQVRELGDIDRVEAIRPPKEDVALASKLLDALEGTFSYEGVRDEYTAAVRELIHAKAEGRAPAAPEAPKAAATSSLADALRASLDAASTAKKAPAKADIPPAKSRKKAS